MPLVPMRAILEATESHHFAQGAFNVNAVAQAKAVIEVHEMFRSAAIIQGADLANAFMGGRTDFANGTIEDKKIGANNIAKAVRKYAANMNAIFVPSAVAALIMHICYGNFTAQGYIGSAVMAAGILVGIPLAAMLVFVPPVLARFEGGASVIVRLAMYFSGKHLLRSVWYLLLLAAAVWSVEFFPLLLLVIPAVYMDLIRGGTEKIMNQYIREAGLEDEQESVSEEAEGEEEPSALALDKLLDDSGGEGSHG